jgi:DNA-binding NtrC family response regulator
VVAIDLPPLRERQDDIPLLAQHFIDKYNRETGKQINRIDSDAMKLLMTYNWPGNVRELENVVERAIVLSTEQKITTIELPPNLKSSYVDVDWTKDNIIKNLSENTKNYEKELITSALKENKGNISKTARVLGIKRTTLRYKMEKYELIG